MKPTIFACAFAVALLTSCNPPPGSTSNAAPAALGGGGGGSSGAANFTLSCHSASTASSRAVHCIRTDTRNGDIQRVTLDKLPVSNGVTAGAPGPVGRYSTSCVAASSDNQADFYCVRLNTDSGEMMMVNLTKVPTMPQ
jgi:hypothetical protein